MGHTAVSGFLLLYLLIPIVIVWAYHLAQRRYVKEGERKRFASLMLTVTLLVAWIAAYIFRQLSVDDLFLIPVLVLVVAALTLWRKALLPYRLRCVRCGKTLPLRKILFFDSNACGACEPDLSREKRIEGDEK